MNDMKAGSTGVRIIPPVIFLVALAAGIGLGYVFPIATPFSEFKWIVGILLVVFASLLAVSSVVLFRKHNTNIDARGSATTLLTSGPYKYSRNPIYLSLVILVIGIGVLNNNSWIVLMLIPAVIFLHKQVILLEEKHLIKQFGEDYRNYSRKVRRWF